MDDILIDLFKFLVIVTFCSAVMIWAEYFA